MQQARVKESGNTMLFEMKCGDAEAGRARRDQRHYLLESPQHTTNVTKSTMSFYGARQWSRHDDRFQMGRGRVQKA